MYKQRLKSNISITIFTLLNVGMLMINMVVSVLWYEQMVRTEIDHATSIVKYTLKRDQGKDYQVETVNSNKLEKIKQMIGSKCIQLSVYFDSEIVSSYNPVFSEDIDISSEFISKKDGVKVKKIAMPGSFFGLGPKITSITIPISGNDKEISIVTVLLNTGGIFSYIVNKQPVICLYILLNSVILSTIGFFRMRKGLLKPLDELVEIADNFQFSEGYFFPDYKENEFGQLSRSMNSMLEMIEKDRAKLRETVESLSITNQKLKTAQKEIVRAEKLAAIGRISSGLAHEIGNPVSIVQGYLELLGFQDTVLEDRQQFVKRSLTELQRVDNLLRRLLDVTREPIVNEEAICIEEIIIDVIDMLKVSAKMKKISVNFKNSSEKSYVFGDEQSLRQVFLNLILNAFDAVDNNELEKVVEVKIRRFMRNEEELDFLEVSIWDNGNGIEKEHLEYIFEPFFTTKAPGKGTGLGLSISYRILRKFGGSIEVDSEQGKWTEFRLLIPIMNTETKE